MGLPLSLSLGASTANGGAILAPLTKAPAWLATAADGAQSRGAAHPFANFVSSRSSPAGRRSSDSTAPQKGPKASLNKRESAVATSPRTPPKKDDGPTAAPVEQLVSLYLAPSPLVIVPPTAPASGQAQEQPPATATATANATATDVLDLSVEATIALPFGAPREGAILDHPSSEAVAAMADLAADPTTGAGTQIASGTPSAAIEAGPGPVAESTQETIPATTARPAESASLPAPASDATTTTTAIPQSVAATSTDATGTPAAAAELITTSSPPLLKPRDLSESRPKAESEPPKPVVKLEGSRMWDNSVAAEPPPPPAAQSLFTGVVRSAGNAETDTNAVAAQVSAVGLANPGRPKQIAAAIDATAAASAIDPSGQPNAAAETSVTAPVAGPATPELPLPKALQQVAETVIERVGKGGGEAHIRLDPPELGGVTIRVQTSGNQVHVEVHTERPEASALLREHAASLSRLLEQSGLALTNVNIGFSSSGFSDSRAQYESTRQAPAAASGFANILGLDSPAVTAQFNRVQAAYNPDGLHMYRI